jgi:predicted PurR-regulated permease PerM
MVWRWIRPDFKQASRIVPGVVEFVLVCVLVILILLGWEMFKTWRRPQGSQRARLSAAELTTNR